MQLQKSGLQALLTLFLKTFINGFWPFIEFQTVLICRYKQFYCKVTLETEPYFRYPIAKIISSFKAHWAFLEF